MALGKASPRLGTRGAGLSSSLNSAAAMVRRLPLPSPSHRRAAPCNATPPRLATLRHAAAMIST